MTDPAFAPFPRAATSEKIMFADIVRQWIEDVDLRCDLAPSTKIEYARVAAHLLEWADGAGQSDVDLVRYVAHRRHAHAAPRTIALELRVACAALRWARRNGIPVAPVVTVPRVRVDAQLFVENHRTPTPAEAAAAIAAMPDDDWRLAALLLARTGARVGEIARLRSCDFDEREGRLALGAVDGARKTGLRWFPLDEASRAALAGRSGRGAAPLFDFGAVAAPIKGLQRRLRRACARAGVPRFTPHGLRRMVVGRLLRARVDPGTAASLTGHSVEVMLKYYQQVTDEDRRAAAVLARLGDLGEPEAR